MASSRIIDKTYLDTAFLNYELNKMLLLKKKKRRVLLLVNANSIHIIMDNIG